MDENVIDELNSQDYISLYNIDQTLQMWPCLTDLPKKLRLPSCSTKREDLGLWVSDDENGADASKVKMENIQRKDRKLRDKDDFTW